MKFWTFGVTLTMTIAIQSLHKTLQLMTMYQSIKLACKRISSSVESHILIYTSPNCDLDLEVSTSIFLHDTLAHDDASQYQVWSQKVQWFRRYYLDKPSSTFRNSAVTLALNTAIQFSHKKLQLMMMYHYIKFGCKRVSSSEDIIESYLNYI